VTNNIEQAIDSLQDQQKYKDKYSNKENDAMTSAGGVTWFHTCCGSRDNSLLRLQLYLNISRGKRKRANAVIYNY